MQFQAPSTLETQIGQMVFAGFQGFEAPDYVLD